jgi:hypothetical protein
VIVAGLDVAAIFKTKSTLSSPRSPWTNFSQTLYSSLRPITSAAGHASS